MSDDDPVKQPPDDDKNKDKPPDPPKAEALSLWALATKEVRVTAKWLATTLGAAAAVVFGGSPIVARTDLNVDDWSTERILLVFVAAVVGVLGIVWIIARAMQTLVPIEVNLTELPSQLRKKIELDPRAYLGGEWTIQQFRNKLTSWDNAAASYPELIAKESDAGKKAILQAEMLNAQSNRDRLFTTRAELLQQATYVAEAARLQGDGWKIFIASLMAIVGAVGYVLLISGKVEEKKEAEGGSSPEIAMLVKHDDGSSDELWQAVDLERCEVDGFSQDQVVVLKLDGDGSTSAPYEVQTLGTPRGCRVTTFHVIDEVATLKVPEPRKITIKYETTTTTRG